MNAPASQLDEAQSARAAMKFTYASGSRPLDGYTIKRGVGRGGFGEVYFATSDAGKEVALKLIRRNLDVELRGATQCLNLKHSNLIGLYDIRTDEAGDQWVIMEYVSGESLEDVIDRNPNGMPVDQVLWWIHGMCAGVAHLHDRGIVHRDLKPGNIFTDEGTVKIGDYGLAKFISCSRRSGQTESVGTVHYMAPEIANGRYGREIDTYALGIILFEMLTGTVPFEGESVGEVLMKHLTAEPDLSRLDEPYRDIVRRALAKDPDVRLKSVGEMVALLPGGESLESGGRPAFHAAQPPDSQRVDDGYAASSAAQYASAGPSGASEAATADIEEPIWKAVRSGFTALQRKAGMVGVGQHALVAWAVFIVLMFMIVVSGGFAVIMGLAIPTLICYGIYYLIWITMIRPGVRRQSLRSGESALAAGSPRQAYSPAGTPTDRSVRSTAASFQPPDTAAATTPAVRYAQQVRRRRMRPNWRDRAHQQLAAKPLRDKLRELTGSMFVAALVAMVVALAMPVLGLGNEAMYVWLAIVGTLGSWAVLVPAKLSEGKLEDQIPMRLVMLLLGGLIGLTAWGLGDALLVNLGRGAQEPVDAGWGLFSHEMLRWQRPPHVNQTTDFRPTMSMYVTFFAFLFVLLRWWRQAEYTRRVRLSLWSVTGCMFFAWLVHLFWWFPQPAGIMAAGTMAIAVQLASPWMPPSRRRALAEEVEPAV